MRKGEGSKRGRGGGGVEREKEGAAFKFGEILQ